MVRGDSRKRDVGVVWSVLRAAGVIAAEEAPWMRHYQAANTLIPMELPHGQQLFLQQEEANSQVFKNTFHGDASENSHNHHLLWQRKYFNFNYDYYHSKLVFSSSCYCLLLKTLLSVKERVLSSLVLCPFQLEQQSLGCWTTSVRMLCNSAVWAGSVPWLLILIFYIFCQYLQQRPVYWPLLGSWVWGYIPEPAASLC